MIFTNSGASGVGKDAVVNFLFDILGDVEFLPSQTTRLPRVGDRGYKYVTEEEFEDMKRNGLLAWFVGPFGNQYGTLISDLELVGLSDESIIWMAILTFDAVEKLRMWASRLELGEVRSIYLCCSNRDELRRRLVERGDKDVERRIEDCKNWDIEAKKYPFLQWIDNSGDLNITRKEVLRVLLIENTAQKPQ